MHILFAMLAAAAAPADDVKIDEIVVTASPLNRSEDASIIGVSVIGEEELKNRAANSIGETLRREPGVSSTFFGPGASRPIIRGLGGDRISVLDAGIGAIDASSTSPDHAVSVEAATAEKIEIVRGAATLLYGSSAAGGVVNVFSGRIPRALPDGGVDGALRIGASTADDGVETAGGFDAALGRGFVFHGEGWYRKADDYAIPGFAESAALRAEEALAGNAPAEEAFGVVENSAFESKGGAAGLSRVFDGGFFGVSATMLDTRYGVPGGHEHEDGAPEEDGGVVIGLKQRRLDFDSAIERDIGIFKRAKMRVGYADYEHTEFEPDGAPGTQFLNEGVEGRLEFIQKTAHLAAVDIDGAVGVQAKFRDFAAIGDEAFTPPSTTRQAGVFTVQEIKRGAMRLELGGRFESTRHEVDALALSRSFNAVSVSGGVGVEPADGLFFGVTVLRTERAPSTEELFSDGAHLATASYEIGDPALGLETARGVEATARYTAQKFKVAINGFYTSYRDFIFERETGTVIDDLPVFAFAAAEATFRGFEAVADAEVTRIGAIDLHADAAIDYVRATAAGGDLPRIPPLSGLFGIEARAGLGEARIEVEYAARQDRVAAFERPTDSYAMINAHIAMRPFGEDRPAVRVAIDNLNNVEARQHTSFLKELAPLPGRNFKISVDGRF